MNEGVEFFRKLKNFLLSLGARNEQGIVVYESGSSVIELDENGASYEYEVFAYTKGRGFATVNVNSLINEKDEEYYFLWSVLAKLGINKKNIN